MQLSYWEYTSWLSDIDYTIVGSGIVGLSSALHLRKRFPDANILVLEQGMLPQGASTKNAGFACFGSISEILEDLTSHSEDEVVALVRQRISGLQRLRQNIGDTQLQYQEHGGYELFTKRDDILYDECVSKIDMINAMLYPIFNAPVYSIKANTFGFNQIQENYIYNAFEGQIHTGMMMRCMLDKAILNKIKILNNVTVKGFYEKENSVQLETDMFSVSTKKLVLATNGFASQLDIKQVKPARAQVLITKPIKNLSIKGTFHLDKGYYYFRNIDNRILFGGGRNLDFSTEKTTILGQTTLVQNELERLLREVILPNTPFEIAQRWSGIMGVGSQKKPIVKQLSENVYCGVRLGGMGVAIGSQVGVDLANLVN